MHSASTGVPGVHYNFALACYPDCVCANRMSLDARYPIIGCSTFSDLDTPLTLYCCSVSFSGFHLYELDLLNAFSRTLGLYAPAHI